MPQYKTNDFDYELSPSNSSDLTKIDTLINQL